MLTFASKEKFVQWRNELGDEPVAVVMTMGALHDGHRALIQTAHEALKNQFHGVGKVVVTVFVNPTQFNEQKDFDDYPQTLAQDEVFCREAGVDAVFAPTTQDMYPEGISNVQMLAPSHHADVLEGPLRPGHFAGVVTIVSRLCDVVRPSIAVFGEKDYQQLVVIRDLFAQEQRDVGIIGVPTVRDSDGVAKSSRNARLSLTGRALAKHIPAAISLVQHALAEGHTVSECASQGMQYLMSQPGVELEYCEIRTPDLELVTHPGTARLFIALRIGQVRLIDNVPLEIGDENVTRR